ncbi:MAG: glycoside hydrolase family 99-like domain-containing protein [Bacteroidota bacterium]|nr:glycoside hydrolase family 99-like domain-containing protein [Bacteroidota bacterium]
MKKSEELFRLKIKNLVNKPSFSQKISYGKVINVFSMMVLTLGLFVLSAWTSNSGPKKQKTKVIVGAYYFDGWAGKNSNANNPDEPWAKTAPTHLTRRMVEEFSDREPVWGWRDDSQAIMEKQIDLAADNGINFFAYCWYWRDSNGPINTEGINKLTLHSSMNFYLKAKNKKRMKFCLLVANHQGSEIKGVENWEKAADFWMQYFKDPQYVKVNGKPLVIIFNTSGIDNEDIAMMQNVAKKHGLAGLTIAGCGNTTDKNFDIRTHYNMNPGYVAGHEEHPYKELVDTHKKQWIGTEKQPYLPEVTVGWDKRPWEDKTGHGIGGAKEGWYFPHRTPAEFHGFLSDAVNWMNEHPKQTTRERMVLVYAWNELGEGGYLMPTKGDPDGSYLKVIKSVVSGK